MTEAEKLSSHFSAQISVARLLDVCKRERQELDRLAPGWDSHSDEFDKVVEGFRMTIADPADELDKMIAALTFLGDGVVTLDQPQILFYKDLQDGRFVEKAMSRRRYLAALVARRTKV